MSTTPTPLSTVDTEIATLQSLEAAEGTALVTLVTDVAAKLNAQAAQIAELQAALAAAGVASPVTTPVDYAAEEAKLAALAAAITGQTATITAADPGATAPAAPAPPATAPTAGPVAVPLTTKVTAPASWSTMPLGVNVDLSPYKPLFGPNDPMAMDLTNAPVNPASAAFEAAVVGQVLTIDTAWNIQTVASSQEPLVKISFTDPADSDNVLWPMPAEPWIEGGTAAGDFSQTANGGDGHCTILDRDTGYLYECISTSSSTLAGAGRVHDVTKPREYPFESSGTPYADGVTRADLVLSYDDARNGIKHALCLTLPPNLLMAHAIQTPACHATGSNPPGTPGCLPMGARLRLKASWQPKTTSLTQIDTNFIAALKKYGLKVSDTGGAGIISSTRDQRWYQDVDASGNQVDTNGTDVFSVFGKHETIGLTLDAFEWVNVPGYPIYSYVGQPVPAGFLPEPTGPAPSLSFTVAKDTTGQFDVLTFSASGQVDILVNGYTMVDASNTLTLPHTGAQTYTAIARNQFGQTTASAGVAA